MKNSINALLPLLCMSAAVSAEDPSVGSGTLPQVPMTPIDIRVNGVSGIKYAQPATVEAYDTLAKVTGRCLADACQKQLFHGSYGDIRAAVTAKLIKDGHGTPLLYAGKVAVTEVTEGEGDEKKVTGYVSVDGKKKFKVDTDVKTEADKAFFDRLCAEKGVEPSHFRELIQEVANANPFDPSRKVRGTATRKIAKAYMESAEGIIAAGDEAIRAVTEQLSELLDKPIDTTDPETRLITLATAIADNELREKREREAKTTNKYLAMAQG